MPINIDADDFLKIIKDNTFQKVIAALVISAVSFFGGRASVPVCDQKIVCADILNDRDKISEQLSTQYKNCQTEKAQELKSIKEDLEVLCADRVDKALSGCEFSEDIHCPICIARGVCKP